MNIRAITEAILADTERRALYMVPICIVGFNAWRGQPYPDAHAWNAAGVFVIIVALALWRMASREAVSTSLLLLLGAIAATLATAPGEESNVARIFIGGLMLVAACAATDGSRNAWDWALSAGLWSEVVVWTLGNAGRGTFGPDVAVSAIGQAYGPWAHPTQLGLIAAGYVCAAFMHNRSRPA